MLTCYRDYQKPSSSNIPNKRRCVFSYINEMPVSAADIAAETKKDPTLAGVLQFTQNGWPSYVDEENLKPYFQRKEELTMNLGRNSKTK